MLDIDCKLEPIWGLKLEEKLHLGVREQKY
jgi:hypothetical protein